MTNLNNLDLEELSEELIQELDRSITNVVKQLKLRSRLSILHKWQRQNQQGIWEIVPMSSSKTNQPMLAFEQHETNIQLMQSWSVPDYYGLLPTIGAKLHLHLIWWAEYCEISINAQKVQEGDLFDQKGRILLTEFAEFDQEFIIEIKLNSPKHDIGALQLAEVHFAYPHRCCDPYRLADELEILQAYVPILAKQADLQVLVKAIAQLQDLLTVQLEMPSQHQEFFYHLAAIRQTLLPYGAFLKQRQVYLLGNSHIDVAWLWAIAETKRAMQRTFTSALDLQERYAELIFNQSTALSYQWMEQEYPQLFKRIQQAVHERRWELVGGMWVEPDGNLPSGESLIRQILYGQAYFQEKFHQEVKIAWLPDTFGFHWQMPQILNKSGFTAFVTQKLCWNDTNKFPYQIFWWEGVDGSKILTYFSNEVGQGIEPVAIAKYLAKQEQQHGITETVWLYGVGDHGGGPTADMLDMGRSWANSPLFMQLSPNTLDNFLGRILEVNSHDLPTWRDELYLEFHRGTYTTKADQKRQNRQMEVRLSNVEKYSAIAYFYGHHPYPQPQIETAWQGLLLNQFHDILPGTSIPEVFVDANQTWREVQEICDQIMPSLHGQQQISTAKIDISQLYVWNFLNWERSQLIRLANQYYWLTSVPSMGCAKLSTVVLSEVDIPDNLGLQVSSDADYFYLENYALKVTVNRHTGDIQQITELKSQISILRSPSTWQFFGDKGQYWDAWNIDPNYADHALEAADLHSIELTVNKLVVTIIIHKRFRQSTIKQEIELTALEPFLTVRNWVNWQEEHILVKAAFPINWRSPFATYEIPMATIDRSTLGETPTAKAKWEVSAQFWADITAPDQSIGLSVLNDCKYGHDAQPDCLRLTLLRSPQWTCVDSDRGEHQFTYRLVPHQGSWQTEIPLSNLNRTNPSTNIVRLAQELNNPLLLQSIASFPLEHIEQNFLSFLQIAATNVIVSSIKRSQDQQGWIIRIYESMGKPTQTEVHISLPIMESQTFLNIQECDLLEKPIQADTDPSEQSPQSVQSVLQSISVELKPYEIKTFYFCSGF
ncbi:MAG: glycoside hydrolase family 38 C-terminal domain-containing protein [Pseudanabaenaceae cyanobacterium bins.39]|nr:glycoside hydrolase family 38 C-terminal domain-containing protein [Pseudanabaenaceae cyanobacterium bins.39]